MSDLFGDWQLDELIAVGGLGEVWRAQRGDASAALKRLHTHLARHAEAREMFALEQELATTLPRHPNVVHAIASGDVASRPYLALELVAGPDLRRLTGTIAAERVVPLAIEACEAAAHLHVHGWIHGDINPSNLVLGDRLVLVDLGVARRAGEAGTVRGTHAYMAPEQVRGEAWTPATDVFALGVVAWELANRTRLFHRGPSWLSAAAVVEAAVPALADPALNDVVQAALAKDPSARIATAEELAHRLRQLLS
jgi:eukaryotic-like serine/threonine-protein kinase